MSHPRAKSDFLLQSWLTCMFWPMYIKQNPEFFYTFWVQERILCINSNWGMLIYIRGKALKDARKLHAWSNLHMHISRHSRIKFKLIFRTTIAICFNSKSTYTHTYNTMMHNWIWNWNGSMLELLINFFSTFHNTKFELKFNLGPPSITCPTTSKCWIICCLLIMG